MTLVEPSVAHQVAVKALRWLHAHRTLGTLPPDADADLGGPQTGYKAVSETALAGSLVLREAVAGPADLRAAEELLEFAWRQLRCGDLLLDRQLRHTLVTDPLEVYAPFARAGLRHAGLDQLLAHQCRLRSLRAVEVVPHRRLAVANAARIVGLDLGYDWAALAATTWLGGLPEPWAIDWGTAYAVTHTVFHLTDWGRLPAGLPRHCTDYLHTWLPVWIEVWGEVGQWDLVGELLIAGACLDEPYDDLAHWERFAAVQHADGLVPRDTEPVEGTPEQVFGDHEHTAVVAVIAGTLASARAEGPHRVGR